MSQIFESMFLSQLCSDVLPTEVGNIIRVSRVNNAEENLTGALLFDGERFCHFLEGVETAVRKRIAKIALDTRHAGFQQLHEGPSANGPRFGTWHVGILAPDGPSPLLEFATLRGVDAVNTLLHLFREKKSHGIHVL